MALTADYIQSLSGLAPELRAVLVELLGQIQAGAVMGYIGAMEYLIRQAKSEMGGENIKVIATGGLARMVADNTELIDIVDPQLVLDGLRIIYQREKK